MKPRTSMRNSSSESWSTSSVSAASLMAFPSSTEWPSMKRRRLGVAERCATFGQLPQEPRRCPALAVLLMPALDLVVHVLHSDTVRPVHQAAAITREAEPVQPHHVHIRRTVRLAFLQDP